MLKVNKYFIAHSSTASSDSLVIRKLWISKCDIIHASLQ